MALKLKNIIIEKGGMTTFVKVDVLTEEDLDQLPASIISKWPGYNMRMAYGIVTPESAEQGDYAETGWEIEETQNFKTLEELLDQVGNDASWLEWSSSHLDGDEWIVSERVEDRDHFEKGEEKTYDLFIKRADGWPLSKNECEYIHKELGLYGHVQYVGKRK